MEKDYIERLDGDELAYIAWFRARLSFPNFSFLFGHAVALAIFPYVDQFPKQLGDGISLLFACSVLKWTAMGVDRWYSFSYCDLLSKAGGAMGWFLALHTCSTWETGRSSQTNYLFLSFSPSPVCLYSSSSGSELCLALCQRLVVFLPFIEWRISFHACLPGLGYAFSSPGLLDLMSSILDPLSGIFFLCITCVQLILSSLQRWVKVPMYVQYSRYAEWTRCLSRGEIKKGLRYDL